MRNRVLSSTLVLLCCCGLVHAQANLVRNPGFEGPITAAGLPGEGWWLYEGRGETKVVVDGAGPHTGKVSARLLAQEDARCALVSPRFEVSPGDELRFEAWVRGEKLSANSKSTYAGLAFRDANGSVFARAYFQPGKVSGDWALVSGIATAPAGAASAEVHLGYTNAPGAVWFDDVRAAITSPQSLALVEGAQPWLGAQEITVRVINRETTPFRGNARIVVGRKQTDVPVALEPALPFREGLGVGSTASEQLVKLPITLTSVGTHNYQISLLDAAAKPVRTLEGKFRTTALLLLFPACPCYHVAGEGSGDTRIDARFVVNPRQRSGLRLAVELKDAAGKVIQTATNGPVAQIGRSTDSLVRANPLLVEGAGNDGGIGTRGLGGPRSDAPEGDIVGVNLRVPVSAPGVFGVVARLLDRDGKELAKADTDIHVSAGAESRVGLGPDGFLRIGGQAHFPIGMYSCGRYDEMGKAGFSGTHNYGITTGEAGDVINPNDAHLKELLDRSWAAGLRMMVELPRKAIEKAQWAQVRWRIETFRHHPGLLCWGSEERVARGMAPLANIAALYRLVHELDPDHPLVLGDTRDVIGKLQKDRRDFFPDDCMDVGIWWWYPIPLHAPDGNGLESQDKNAALLQPPAWLTTTHSRKPLWIAIQSYQHPRPDARFPTPAEYRCLAYLSLINGAKGLWFYTGSGQKDWQGKPAGLLNKPEEGHWDYVQQLVRELRELEQVITAKPVMGKITLSPPDAPVEFTVRELDGKIYLLAANKSDRPQSVRFTGGALAGKKVAVLCEQHAAAIQDEALADDFGPFGVHVYRLE